MIDYICMTKRQKKQSGNNQEKKISQTPSMNWRKKNLEAYALGHSIKINVTDSKRDILDKIKAREKETPIQQVVNHYFYTKGLTLDDIKQNARKRKIIYSRFTRPAKQLLELAGSLDKAKEAIDTVAQWAKSRDLDYAIETVFKKWLELDRLKPKEKVKKPFFHGNPMIWSKSKKKWFVVDEDGEWREFAGQEEEIKWKIVG